MTMTFELPEAGIELGTTATPVAETSDAGEAAAMLDDKNGVGDDVTIVLVKDIDDAANDFHATKGQTFTAAIDAEGDTYIPIPVSLGSEQEEGRVYLEAEEFEIVELANGCAEAFSDQPADESTQAEPADQPVTDAEIRTAVQYQPGSVTPAAEVVATADKQASARSRYLLSKANLEESISALTIEEAKLKQQAKRAKKEREVLTEQLIELIDAWERGDEDTEQPTTVEGGAALQASGNGIGPQNPEQPDCPAEATPPFAAESAVSPSQESEVDTQVRYRAVLEAVGIAELGLPAKVEKKLTEAGAGTIWQLEQLRGEISLGREKWPKGIGAAKITAIEDAVSQWVARNAEQWERSPHPLPRTPEQIEETNRRLAEQQDKQQAAEVAEASPDHRCAIDDL
jgi:hypothetical protein